jgi:cell division protein FtsB
VIWDKLTRIVLFLLFVATCLGVVVWYLPLIHQNEQMRKEILSLENQVKEREEAVRRLDMTIRSLKNDPKTVERLAREKLGYAKPGEQVIYFDQTEPAAPSVVR